MNGVLKMPAAPYLFNVNDSVDKLNKGRAQLFHHLVAKWLYLSAEANMTSKQQ